MTTWGRLTDLIKSGKGLTYESTLFFVFSLDHIQLFAIELNTGGPNIPEYGQLFIEGIDSKGVDLERIGGGYAPSTKELKRFEGLPFDHITLYQDGDFYRSFKFVQQGDGFEIHADTIKEGVDLQDRWGSDILGLTNESIEKLAIEIIPEVIDYIISKLLQ